MDEDAVTKIEKHLSAPLQAWTPRSRRLRIHFVPGKRVGGGVRLLCAHDHPLVRDGVSFALREVPDIQLVAEADNGIAAVEAFRAERPDVVLLDLQLPRLSSIDALPQKPTAIPMKSWPACTLLSDSISVRDRPKS